MKSRVLFLIVNVGFSRQSGYTGIYRPNAPMTIMENTNESPVMDVMGAPAQQWNDQSACVDLDDITPTLFFSSNTSSTGSTHSWQDTNIDGSGEHLDFFLNDNVHLQSSLFNSWNMNSSTQQNSQPLFHDTPFSINSANNFYSKEDQNLGALIDSVFTQPADNSFLTDGCSKNMYAYYSAGMINQGEHVGELPAGLPFDSVVHAAYDLPDKIADFAHGNTQFPIGEIATNYQSSYSHASSSAAPSWTSAAFHN